MKASEILRKLADVIDAKEGDQVASTEITNCPSENEIDMPADASSIERQAQVNIKPMISPLQLQAELLKTATGQELEVCPQCNAEPCCCDSHEVQTDELTIIKQNAGI